MVSESETKCPRRIPILIRIILILPEGHGSACLEGVEG